MHFKNKTNSPKPQRQGGSQIKANLQKSRDLFDWFKTELQVAIKYLIFCKLSLVERGDVPLAGGAWQQYVGVAGGGSGGASTWASL